MWMKYLDGSQDGDGLFDRPVDEQRAYVAKQMNLAPDPSDWPIETLDRLLTIRRFDGREKFYREIARIMSAEARL